MLIEEVATMWPGLSLHRQRLYNSMLENSQMASGIMLQNKNITLDRISRERDNTSIEQRNVRLEGFNVHIVPLCREIPTRLQQVIGLRDRMGYDAREDEDTGVRCCHEE